MNRVELISEDALETTLLHCLEERHLPDCFLYLGESGVRNWLKLSASEAFPVAERLTGLLKEGIPSIARHLPGRFDLVSVGVGGGEKERVLLEAFAGQHAVSYVAVDISAGMVDAALRTVEGIDVPKTGVVAFLEDLEQLRRLWRSPVLLCLLGNSFCNYEPDGVLDAVHRELGSEDLFLFDCHLLPGERVSGEGGRDEVERVYRSQLNVRFNIEPLVERGLDPGDCVFHLDLVRCGMRRGPVYRTSKWLEILKDTTLSCGVGKVRLARGETIRMGFTYKYTSEQVRGLLEDHGFDRVEMLLGRGFDNLLALVRKGMP